MTTLPSGAAEPAADQRSVTDILSTTAPEVLGLHLEWLVTKARGQPQLSNQRVLFEDQSKILIDALAEREEHDLVLKALAHAWSREDHEEHRGPLVAYASELECVTAGEPVHSPYKSLAQSSRRLCGELRPPDTRGS